MFSAFQPTFLFVQPPPRQGAGCCKSCGKTLKRVPCPNKLFRVRQPKAHKKALFLQQLSCGLVSTNVQTNIEQWFSFPLDDFQLAAIEAIERRESVLVAAPTGSGKTVIAEAAIHIALAAGKRIFYTTPLKALSNQKFHDCQKIFGVSRVGLLTGDVTIQRDADILVLTTEIYRNMLYADSVDISDSVFAVVFDEFHFMNDPERGTVWEEAVIASPKDIILVALSATMSNAAQLKDWLSCVHRKTSLFETHIRPVPLHFQFCNHRGLQDILDLLKKDENGIPKVSRALLLDIKQRGQVDKRRHSTLRSRQSPSMHFLVGILSRRKMLPCILFVFSRVGCDKAAEELGVKLGFRLVNRREQGLLQSRISQFVEDFPEIAAQQKERLSLLQQGISVHHAGLLPVWKNFIEELFIDGLIKVIFATETLAAGMNMPARTTVITALYKRGDNGMERLSTSSFKQMAGRAGRRGKDSQGFCIILQSPDVHPRHVVQLVTGQVEAITSKFLPKYGLVLSLLLDGKSPQQVKEFLSKSFGNFLFAYERKRQEQEKATELEQYKNAMRTLTETNIMLEEWKKYRRLQQKLKMEARTLKYLTKQSREMRRQVVEGCLLFANSGLALYIMDDSSSKASVIQTMTCLDHEQNESLDFDKEPQVEMAWLLESYSFNDHIRYLCFTDRNRFRVVELSEIIAVAPNDSPAVLGPNMIEVLMNEYKNQRQLDRASCTSTNCVGTEKTANILATIPKQCNLLHDIKEEDPKLLAQRRKVSHIQSKMEQSAIHSLKNRKQLLRLYEKVNKWQKKSSQQVSVDSFNTTEHTTSIEELDKSYSDEDMTKSWQYVQSVLKTLHTLGFIENIRFTTEETWYRVTALGKLCATIRGENEVWLSIVLGYLCGHVQNYEPYHLIGVVAAVIGDPIREDAVINWEASSRTSTLLAELQRYYDQVVDIQNRNGIVCVTRFEYGWSGIAETWAKEANWSRLLSNTSLDEGDICRNLRRVLDILRQIPRLPSGLGIISEEFRLCAQRAMALMNHFPVCDDITYSLELE